MKNNLGKRELNKARKRAEIVAIAKHLFFEQGYAATSMTAIAEKLGGSKATLWGHFGSKEEVLAAVIDQHVDSFSRDLDEVLTGQSFSLPGLRKVCLRFMECLLREHSVMLFQLVLTEGGRFPEISELFYSRGPARIRKSMAEFYATRFAEEEANRLMRVTIAAITGLRTDILMRPGSPALMEIETFVDELIQTTILPASREAGLAGHPLADGTA